jgi:hypothetical protein
MTANHWPVRYDVYWWANAPSNCNAFKDDKAKQAIILMETDPGAVINEHVPTSSNKR